jgi:hypothetical protein
MNRLKFKRECYKCKLIDIELSDTIYKDLSPLPIINLLNTRRIRKEYIFNKIKNRMKNINQIYKDEINNDYVLYT